MALWSTDSSSSGFPFPVEVQVPLRPRQFSVHFSAGTARCASSPFILLVFMLLPPPEVRRVFVCS